MTPTLTAGQAVFAEEFTAKTGLDKSVVIAWLLAEQSGTFAANRQRAGNMDWLDVGYTDAQTFGADDPAWTDAKTAADRTYQWMLGTWHPEGYGVGSPGVRAILDTAGKSPAVQIAAIQNSGWASSHYPTLPALYNEVKGSGQPLVVIPKAGKSTHAKPRVSPEHTTTLSSGANAVPVPTTVEGAFRRFWYAIGTNVELSVNESIASRRGMRKALSRIG